MSSFRFGVAFERLLFSALNKYLLKNSSSIETDIRSLITSPCQTQSRCASHEYLSLYLLVDIPSLSGILRRAAVICSTPQHPFEAIGDRLSRLGPEYLLVRWVSYAGDFCSGWDFHTSAVMQDKSAVLLVLLIVWLFWFVFFLTSGI